MTRTNVNEYPMLPGTLTAQIEAIRQRMTSKNIELLACLLTDQRRAAAIEKELSYLSELFIQKRAQLSQHED